MIYLVIILVGIIVASFIGYAYLCTERKKSADNLIELIKKEMNDDTLPFNLRFFNVREKCRAIKGLPSYVVHEVFNDLRYAFEEWEEERIETPITPEMKAFREARNNKIYL